jgi:hypothetical protein
VDEASESQNEKRRKSIDYFMTSTPAHHTTTTPQKKETTLSIDRIDQMWLGFQMHEALMQEAKS